MWCLCSPPLRDGSASCQSGENRCPVSRVLNHNLSYRPMQRGRPGKALQKRIALIIRLERATAVMKKNSEKTNKFQRSVVPQVPSRILDELFASNIWIGRVNESILEFNNWLVRIPEKYHWRFKTSEAFTAEVNELRLEGPSFQKLNSIYWVDSLKNLEAYTIMSTWRSAELLKGAVTSLVEGKTIISAILTRSALETVVQFVDVARKVAPTIREALKHDFSSEIIVPQELEELILKSVFSSRLPGGEEHSIPTNILTIISRAAKVQGQEDLSDHYAKLCEATHPNFLGRSVYVTDIQQGGRPGDELRTLSRDHGPTASDIAASAVWGISWSAATQVSSALLMQNSIAVVIDRLKTTMH